MSSQGVMITEKKMTNLEKLLAMKGWTSVDLARYLGLSEKTGWNKTVSKTSQFKWNEVLKVKKLFPEYPIDYIFEGYGQE